MPYSKEDMKRYMDAYYRERREQYVNYLGGVCVVCSSTDSLEIDHVYWQDKSFTVMSKWSLTDQSIVYAELDKCQLLCGVHHKLKTAQDKAEMSYHRPMKHGNMYTWQKLKCQCDTCNTARRAWNVERNARRRA